jgi:hypothetical protein
MIRENKFLIQQRVIVEIRSQNIITVEFVHDRHVRILKLTETNMTKIGWGLINQAFCTDLTDPEEIVREANLYFHPGTHNGWVWPSDEALQRGYDAIKEKMEHYTVEDLRNGIPCEVKGADGFKHYMLHC